MSRCFFFLINFNIFIETAFGMSVHNDKYKYNNRRFIKKEKNVQSTLNVIPVKCTVYINVLWYKD